MNKVTKKELVERANEHEEAIFQIKKALEQHGINWFVEEPKLKQLDQSVFDDEPPHLKWAAVEEDGGVYLFALKPFIDLRKWAAGTDEIEVFIDHGYDASDWQNSLIERKELTGSDLCRAMLERGDNYVMCRVGMIKNVVIINKFEDGWFYSQGVRHADPTPINNQGEPLTAAEVGL